MQIGQYSRAAASWGSRPRGRTQAPATLPTVTIDCAVFAPAFDGSDEDLAPQRTAASSCNPLRLPSQGGAFHRGAERGRGQRHSDCVGLLDSTHLRAVIELVLSNMPCHGGRPAMQVDMDGNYFQYIDLEAGELQQRGFVLHEVGGADAVARWAALRARHHPGGRDDKGWADGTVQALKVARKQLIVCRACSALVQLQAARRLARKVGRAHIADSDGCSSPMCTSSHAQPQRFARGQAERAAGLLGGSHTLVLPPPTTAARTHLWVAPAHLARTIALEAAHTAVGLLRARASRRRRPACCPPGPPPSTPPQPSSPPLLPPPPPPPPCLPPPPPPPRE